MCMTVKAIESGEYVVNRRYEYGGIYDKQKVRMNYDQD